MHKHYAKNVLSKLVINTNSALPMNTKRTVLAQEGLPILLNCSRELPWESKAKHLNSLSLRTKTQKYKKQFRNCVRPLYRNREWNEIERREMKDN